MVKLISLFLAAIFLSECAKTNAAVSADIVGQSGALAAWRSGDYRINITTKVTYNVNGKITSIGEISSDQLFDKAGRIHLRITSTQLYRDTTGPIEPASPVRSQYVLRANSFGYYVIGASLQHATLPQSLSDWREIIMSKPSGGGFLDGRITGVGSKFVDVHELASRATSIQQLVGNTPDQRKFQWKIDEAEVSVMMVGSRVIGYEYIGPVGPSGKPTLAIRVSGLEYGEFSGRQIAVRGIYDEIYPVNNDEELTTFEHCNVVAERLSVSFQPTITDQDFSLVSVPEGTLVYNEDDVGSGINYEWRGGKPVSDFKEEKAAKLSNYADASVQGFESAWPSWVKRLLLVLLSCGALGVGALLWQRSRAA